MRVEPFQFCVFHCFVVAPHYKEANAVRHALLQSGIALG